MVIILKTSIYVLMWSLITMYFFLKKSPAKLIFLIITSTTIFSMEISKVSKNAWIGFSLFLLIVSGLMILFSLITSITPKMKFGSSKMLIFYFIIMIPLIFISKSNPYFSLSPNSTVLYKLELFMLMIILLNLILLVISKLISSPEKTFRSKNYSMP